MSLTIIEQGISFWVGFTLVIASQALLWHPRGVVQLIHDISEKTTSITLLIGWLNLSFGAFILGFHWRWDDLGAVLTIVGLLSTAKGVLAILAPGIYGSMIVCIASQEEKRLCGYFRIGGLAQLLLGALILANWYQSL